MEKLEVKDTDGIGKSLLKVFGMIASIPVSLAAFAVSFIVAIPEELVQETRRFDDVSGKTFAMRNKETEADYRYFPDANIMPIIIDDEWLEQIKSAKPVAVDEKAEIKKGESRVFRVNDRIMQLKNNYDIEWEKNGAVGVGLFNGDIGVIEYIDLNEEVVKVRFDDRTAEYSYDMLEELELA